MGGCDLEAEQREADPAESEQSAGADGDRSESGNQLSDRHDAPVFEGQERLCPAMSAQ